MTITTGAAIFQEATQNTVISDTSAIADGAFNAGTNTALTPTDVVPLADAVLDVQFSVAPGTTSAFYLYRRDLNIDGTNDATVPSANFEHIFVGVFPVESVTTRQYISLSEVPISNDQEFRIKNETGQSTTGTTVLKVTPKTFNAKT